MRKVDIEPIYQLLANTKAQHTMTQFLEDHPALKPSKREKSSNSYYVVHRDDLQIGNPSTTEFAFNPQGQICTVSWSGSFSPADDGESAFYDLSDLIQKGFKRTYQESRFCPYGFMGEKRWRTFKPMKFERIEITTRQPDVRNRFRTLHVYRGFRQPEAAGPPPKPPTHISFMDLCEPSSQAGGGLS